MRVAFDIGGTFTDVISVDAVNQIRVAKVLSLLEQVGSDIARFARGQSTTESVKRFVHATTICSNAIIEGNAARVGLITTSGFRDTLELRAQRGPSDSDYRWMPPPALIPRNRCVEIVERIRADGSIAVSLDVTSVRRAIQMLIDSGVNAIAVCLINSYMHPLHERAVGDLIVGMAPGLVYCLSSDVLPEVREYDRSSTTVINTALIPVVNAYLDQLQGHLVEFSPDLHIMQSSGGLMTSRAARLRPMRMIESGPAAGVLASARLGSEMGLREVLSFDMGGTTAKACYIANGKPSERPSAEVAAGTTAGGSSRDGGHILRVPTVDLVEVGAGGGSIAWLDKGALKIGPMSAGANPGPVCYGRGGQQPTVTDANIVLGKINPASIADGQLLMDHAAATRAIAQISKVLSLELLPTAHGITQIANVVMMRALRAVLTERGYDPRRCTMVCYGGAGPLHAAALAEGIGITRIVVPPFAGVFSALGLLLADYRFDYVASIVTGLEEVDGSAILARFDALEAQARADFIALGMPAEVLRFERQADLRYKYQIDDIGIPLPVASSDRLSASLREGFQEAHRREFGFIGTGVIILVNLRLRALAAAEKVHFADLAAGQSKSAAAESLARDVYFGPEHGLQKTAVVRRDAINDRSAGPLIVEDPDTTVVIPPGWSLSRHENGSLVLTYGS